jgi:outer membrane lipoprotein-sorting protein
MRRTIVLFSLLTVAAAAAPARADGTPKTAAEIVKRADETYANWADYVADVEMSIYEPGSTTVRKFNFSIFLKGFKRLVRFTSPDDVRGMGMLLHDRENLWVYLPGFQRVRKMSTHTKGQTFMGSDFGYEDMAESVYTGYWIPTLAGSDGNQWMIDMVPAPGVQCEFPRQRVWFDKTRYLATRIEYYDEKGNNARSEIRTDFKRDEGPIEHYSPYTVTITDHRRNDHHTTMKFFKAKVNGGVSDDLFNQRGLMRGGL